MSPTAFLARLLGAGLLLGLGSCTDGNVTVDAVSNTGVEAVVSGPGPNQSASVQLLGLMENAASTTVHQGLRRYEANWTLDGVAQTLIYREDVIANGAGDFSIETVEVLAPTLSDPEEDLFLLLQKAREGFFFKHRDFAIRSADLLLANWTIADLGPTTFLGRPSTQLRIQRQVAPTTYYDLVVDSENGLVLRSEERAMTGELISLMEFETLTLMPSLTGVTWHQGTVSETLIESRKDQLAELSFVPVKPKLLPPGYELIETAVVSEPSLNGDWARFTYSDGVEELFFLHEGPSGPSAGGASLVGGPVQAGGPQNNQDVVNFLYVGPWTLLFGEIDDEGFMALGKVSREELRDVVESAFF